MAKKRLILIDGNAIIHRAYHALPPLKNKKGQVVGAVYGYLLAFFKTIKDFEPDYVVATFDFPAKTFRHQKYRLYKANREKAPDDLYAQIPMVKDLMKDFDVPVFELKGFEADDLIGTLSTMIAKKYIVPGIEVIILSGDQDLLQLVDKNTKAYLLRRGVKDTILYDKKAVVEKYQGLTPDQLVDYKALRGDPSDNIPGVLGIGEKTAIFLIKEFGSLKNLYKELKSKSDKAEELKPALKEKLTDYEDQAFVSQMLAQIKKDIPLDFDLEDSSWGDYDKDKVVESLRGFGFKSLVARITGKPEVVEKSKKKEVKNNLSLW